MFFTLKERNFSHSEKRRDDHLASLEMEEELRIATQKRAQEEARAATAQPISSSRIATPGFRTSSSLGSGRRAATPSIRKRFGV
jgi:hypothetical protein